MEDARILALAFTAVMAGLAAGQYTYPLDVTNDGIVDISDFDLVCDNWLWAAAAVVAGVKADRFWILTHDSTREASVARVQRAAGGVNPPIGVPES